MATTTTTKTWNKKKATPLTRGKLKKKVGGKTTTTKWTLGTRKKSKTALGKRKRTA